MTVPIIGYETSNIGTLRLWQCEAEEELDFDAFNAQDYTSGRLDAKNRAEDITRVLYPNDCTWEGKRLRVKQQYVLSRRPRCRTSCAAIRRPTGAIFSRLRRLHAPSS